MLWKGSRICNNSKLLFIDCSVLSTLFVSIILILTKTYEVGTIINLILEKTEMKYREVM